MLQYMQISDVVRFSYKLKCMKNFLKDDIISHEKSLSHHHSVLE